MNQKILLLEAKFKWKIGKKVENIPKIQHIHMFIFVSRIAIFYLKLLKQTKELFITRTLISLKTLTKVPESLSLLVLCQ